MEFVHMKALVTKECKDLLKNMERLILFIMYPIIAFIMIQAMSSTMEGANTMFVAIFGAMHALFSPMMIVAGIVAEEKEKKTLRELMLARVTPVEFMLSVGSFILFCSVVTAIPFTFYVDHTASERLLVLLCFLLGSMISTILGMTLGLFAKNTASVTAYTMPVAVVVGFTPMLANFSPTIAKFSRFLYGQQVSDWIADVHSVTMSEIIIVIVNAIIILGLFIFAFGKNRREK